MCVTNIMTIDLIVVAQNHKCQPHGGYSKVITKGIQIHRLVIMMSVQKFVPIHQVDHHIEIFLITGDFPLSGDHDCL